MFENVTITLVYPFLKPFRLFICTLQRKHLAMFLRNHIRDAVSLFLVYLSEIFRRFLDAEFGRERIECENFTSPALMLRLNVIDNEMTMRMGNVSIHVRRESAHQIFFPMFVNNFFRARGRNEPLKIQSIFNRINICDLK